VDGQLTEAPLLITRTLPSLPVALLLRAMCIRIMFVPHLFKEMDFILGGEEPDAKAVYRSITPSLKRKQGSCQPSLKERHKEVGKEESRR
jgi:hypothetical protein